MNKNIKIKNEHISRLKGLVIYIEFVSKSYNIYKRFILCREIMLGLKMLSKNCCEFGVVTYTVELKLLHYPIKLKYNFIVLWYLTYKLYKLQRMDLENSEKYIVLIYTPELLQDLKYDYSEHLLDLSCDTEYILISFLHELRLKKENQDFEISFLKFTDPEH
jgi:hypothetical protein